MAQNHSVYNTDEHFKIDPITRVISQKSGKTKLMHGDHNSERYEFEMSRYIDGYDITLCNKVEIHWINASSSSGGKYNADIYLVDDVHVDTQNSDNLVFSWLVSANSTQYVGSLNFAIRFINTGDDGQPVYVWSTAVHTGISIADSINNSSTVIYNNSDILREWESRLFGIGDTVEQHLLDTSIEQQAAIEAKGELVLSTIPEDYTKTSMNAIEALVSKAPSIVITQEGETIALDDSADMFIQGLRVFGRTDQSKTTGKNLVDLSGFEFNDNTYAHSYYPPNSATSDKLFNFLKMNTGKTVVLSVQTTGEKSGVDIGSIFFYNISEGQSTALIRMYPNVPVTIPEMPDNYTDCSVYGSMNGASAKNFQLEYGEVATEYEPFTGGQPSPSPDYPQELVNVGNAGNIGVQVCGKNLLDTSKYIPGNMNGVAVTVDPDGLIHLNGTATIGGGRLNGRCYIVLKPGKYRIVLFDTNGTPRNSFAAGVYLSIRETGAIVTSGAVEFEVTETIEYTFGINVAEGVSYNNDAAYVMVCSADADYSSYEPYKPVQTLTLSTPNGLPGIPVKRDGNYTDENKQRWVCDEIDLARGVYIQRIARIKFDDVVVNYYERPAGSGIMRFDIEQFNNKWLPKPHANAGWEGMCNALAYSGTTTGSNLVDNAICAYSGGGLFARCDKYTSAEDFKAAAVANGWEVLYTMATPVETTLDAETLAAYRALHTNKPNTTIINDAAAHMAVQYVADTKTYIDNKFVELAAAMIDNA